MFFPARTWRTYSFRILLLYFALLGAAVLILFGAIYRVTAHFMEDQLRAEIHAEEALLIGSFDAGGIDRITFDIKRRAGRPGHTADYYLLQDPNGTPVAGNLAARAPTTGWTELAIPPHLDPDEVAEPGEEDTLLAHGQMLSNGWFLLVGKNTDRFGDFEDEIVRIAAWSLGGVLLLVIAAGSAVSLSMTKRLHAITETSGEIIRGNLARRIALKGSGDEFDQLSVNLNAMLDRIQALMEGLRQVSNDIAHDLRTPLARLRQGLEGARDRAESAADLRAAVETAIAETDAILETFGALLRIARIESGTQRADFTPVDFSGLVRTIAETYAPVAEDHAHDFTARIAEGVMLQGDRPLLTQMLANLVENAIRHTPAGTRIALALEPTAAGPICRIEDNGPGIPEAERRRVFRRFYRLDASRSTPGSGLGLSLVAAVAELHWIKLALDDAKPGLIVSLQFPPL